MDYIVSKDSNLNSIASAINKAKGGDTIFIKNGIYHEKLKIKKSNINIIGESKENTIIEYDDYALKIHKKDNKEYNTFRTYTVMLLGNNINISNITIKNTSGDGRLYGQAVALHTIGDNIKLDNVILDAYQDTLFIGPLPKDLIKRYEGFLEDDERVYPIKHKVYIRNSTILGDVDFIFGAGSLLVEDSIIISKARDGFVVAPAQEIDEDDGFTFINSKFLRESDKTKSYLARPWRDYGKVSFINCLYENHILDIGFDKWNDTSRDLTCRFYEKDSSYFDKHEFKRAYFINKDRG